MEENEKRAPGPWVSDVFRLSPKGRGRFLPCPFRAFLPSIQAQGSGRCAPSPWALLPRAFSAPPWILLAYAHA